jgi:hypothetical protein
MLEAIVALAIVAFFVVALVTNVLTIGKPRKPITHGQAVWAMGIQILIVLGVLFLWVA